MSDYFKRLKQHPGVPIATIMTIGGCLLGGIEDPSLGFVGGFIIGGLTWIPVLITARTQPLPKEDKP